MNAIEKYYHDACQEKIKEIAPLIRPRPAIVETEYDVRFILNYEPNVETIFYCHSYETLYAVINAFRVALEVGKYFSMPQPE